MLVYRVEHADGLGPYQYWGRGEDMDFVKSVAQLHHDFVNDHLARGRLKHPDASRDCKGFTDGFHFCGFKAVEDLQRWFRGFIERLHSLGFVLGVYEILDQRVIVGEYQVGFPKREAKLVESRSLLSVI